MELDIDHHCFLIGRACRVCRIWLDIGSSSSSLPYQTRFCIQDSPSASRLKNNNATESNLSKCLIPWMVSLWMVWLVRWCRGRAGRWPWPPPCLACPARSAWCPPTAGRTRGRTGRGRRARGRPQSPGPSRWCTGPRHQSVVFVLISTEWTKQVGLTYTWGVTQASDPLLLLPIAQAGCWNITNISQCNLAIWADGPPGVRYKSSCEFGLTAMYWTNIQVDGWVDVI